MVFQSALFTARRHVVGCGRPSVLFQWSCPTEVARLRTEGALAWAKNLCASIHPRAVSRAAISAARAFATHPGQKNTWSTLLVPPTIRGNSYHSQCAEMHGLAAARSSTPRRLGANCAPPSARPSPDITPARQARRPGGPRGLARSTGQGCPLFHRAARRGAPRAHGADFSPRTHHDAVSCSNSFFQ